MLAAAAVVLWRRRIRCRRRRRPHYLCVIFYPANLLAPARAVLIALPTPSARCSRPAAVRTRENVYARFCCSPFAATRAPLAALPAGAASR